MKCLKQECTGRHVPHYMVGGGDRSAIEPHKVRCGNKPGDNELLSTKKMSVTVEKNNTSRYCVGELRESYHRSLI